MLTIHSPNMCRLHRTARSGFTLVELLVVIAIIAILAAVVAVSAGAAINAAKRAKMATLAGQIQTAVLSYYTEYSTYPVPAPGTDVLFQAPHEWQPVTVALNGGVDPGNPTSGQFYGNNPPVPNTRQIPYLTFTRPDLDTTVTPAVPKTPFTGQGGKTQYFFMAVDADYSNILGDTGGNTKPPDFSSVTSRSTALPAGKELSAGVAVWANGDPATNGNTTHPNLWIHTY
jgi:prepilin-type N-terminal cleavage/methylation domain-containing protein